LTRKVQVFVFFVRRFTTDELKDIIAKEIEEHLPTLRSHTGIGTKKPTREKADRLPSSYTKQKSQNAT
jgi:hypothetical protein